MNTVNQTKEIDLHALLINLKYESHDVSPFSLYENKSINLIPRNFEENRKWSKVEQTSYIESIFLGYALGPIIRFQNYNHTTIVDGYNRYLTICNFCKDELVLDIKGLKELKFLANKKFSDLKLEKEFFIQNNTLKIFDYKYESKDREFLFEEEELEVEKYLHVIYNTGIRLELEELQKAQFSDDFLTNRIKEELENSSEFLETVEKLKLYNGNKKRNKIENILLNCRLLIASTHSNINDLANTKNLGERIEKNYLPNLKNKNLEIVFQEFIININQIYNSMINTQKWNIYPILHVKPFIDATYWLISIIRKDKLGDPFNFDFMKYLEYFGNREEQEKNFNYFQAHYKKNIYKKYWVVAQYYEKEYGVDMSFYFKKVKAKNISEPTENTIEEISKNRYHFEVKEIKIYDLLIQLKNGKFNLRPYYQRKEVMNKTLSSRIIESILLGIKIPYILAYTLQENNNYITEIVDGQQRLLSIISFLQQPFMNEKGILEYSNKNGYALKDLRILTKLNGLKSISSNKKEKLSEIDIQKILNYTIYICKTNDCDSKNFSAIDHFIRLNKSICTLKENTYRMWSLTSDRKIIEYEKNITKNFTENILPKENKEKKPNIITLKLAYLFYTKKFNEISLSNYSNRKISLWLKEFNQEKDKHMYKNIEKITELRKKYFDALDDTKEFYIKISDFLQSMDKNINDLVERKTTLQIPISNYYYLFCMIGDMSKEDLLENNKKIYEILHNFFIQIKAEKLDNQSIINLLSFTIQKILIFNTSKRYEFKERLSLALEEIQ